jgi:hypothetical protein
MVPLFVRLKWVSGTTVQKLKRVDWFGNAIFIAAMTTFLIPVTWGGVQYPWSSWQTLVPLILGSAGLVGFVLYEKYVANEPTMRLSVFGSYNMAYSLFANFITALIVYSLLYFLPLYYEGVKGYDPIITGVALFPATFTIAPVSIIAGIIIAKTGDFRVLTWAGWLAATLGGGITCLLNINTTTVQWIFLTLPAGVGLGLLYTSLTFVNQAASSDSDMAFAVTIFVFFRCLGQCIGVAIGGTIFQNQMKQRLLAIPALAADALAFSRDASRLVQQIKGLPEGDNKAALVQVYADSLRIVWAVICALSGVAAVGSLFVRKMSLNRAHHTEQGLVGQEGKRDVDDVEVYGIDMVESKGGLSA